MDREVALDREVAADGEIADAAARTSLSDLVVLSGAHRQDAGDAGGPQRSADLEAAQRLRP